MLCVSTVLGVTFLLIVLFLQQNGCEAFVGKTRLAISSVAQTRRPTLSLAASSSSFLNIQQPFLLAEGLDPETLQALGEVTELNDALDSAVKAANPAVVSVSLLDLSLLSNSTFVHPFFITRGDNSIPFRSLTSR